MTRKAKPSKLLTDYAQFLTSLEPSVIALRESTVKGDRDKYLEAQNHAITIGWKSRSVTLGPEHFDVFADLNLTVSKPKSHGDFLELSATYYLHIHCRKRFPPEYVDRFCNSEIRLIVWPYFREYVTNVCGRMHIPPVFLPLATLGTKE
jgi:preprotein translocase subunit SecB